MNRSRSAALAALCVLALALGAATLDTPVADDGGLGGEGSTGLGDAPTEGVGGSTDPNATRDLGDVIAISGLCIPFFTSTPFYLGVLVVALVAGAALHRRGGPLLVFAVFGSLFAPGFLLWMLVTTCGAPPDARAGNVSLFPGENGTFAEGVGGGGGPGNGMPSLATTILLVLGLALVVVSVVLLRASGDDVESREAPPPEPDAPADSLAELAGVAGDAADRIETGDRSTENEVYRAWRQMTDQLDVPNPHAASPAEFRAAARDAGMAPRHVDALTDLFRDVRYGGEPVTEARETAAVAALRAIEDVYGGGDGA